MENNIIEYEFEDQYGETHTFHINLWNWEIEKACKELGIDPKDWKDEYEKVAEYFYERAKEEFEYNEEYRDTIDVDCMTRILKELKKDGII